MKFNFDTNVYARTSSPSSGGRTILLLALTTMLCLAVACALLSSEVPRGRPATLQLVLQQSTQQTYPFPNGAGFFAAAPQGFNNNRTLEPPLVSDLQRLGIDELLGWETATAPAAAAAAAAPAARTEPLVDIATTLRILGGWSASKGPSASPASWADIAYRAAGGKLGYRWGLLWSRLDPLVNNSINPIIVLDNVDYVFVRNASVGRYGYVVHSVLSA